MKQRKFTVRLMSNAAKITEAEVDIVLSGEKATDPAEWDPRIYRRG